MCAPCLSVFCFHVFITFHIYFLSVFCVLFSCFLFVCFLFSMFSSVFPLLSVWSMHLLKFTHCWCTDWVQHKSNNVIVQKLKSFRQKIKSTSVTKWYKRLNLWPSVDDLWRILTFKICRNQRVISLSLLKIFSFTILRILCWSRNISKVWTSCFPEGLMSPKICLL